MTINALSSDASLKALDHLMGGAAWTMPAGTFLKAHLGDPGEACTANPAATTTRVEVTTWSAAAARATSNTATSQLTMTAGETVSWWSMWTAVSGGLPLFYGQLATPRVMAVDDILEFAPGDLDLDFLGTDLTTFAGNALLDHLTGTTAMTQPAGRFLSFHVGDPGVAGTGNAANLTTRSDCGAFSAAAGGSPATTANAAQINATGTATETLSHGVIHSAVTAGNPLWFFPFTTAKAVDASTPIRLGAGVLTPSIQ